MDVQKIVKESKIIMYTALVTGLVLLAAGVIVGMMDLPSINSKALVALSLTPWAVAAMYFVKVRKITKSPQQMRSLIINEIDERLVAQRNEADHQAFKIVQAAIFLTYMGYTLMFPGDVFEAVGWWILLGLLFTTMFAPALLLQRIIKLDNSR